MPDDRDKTYDVGFRKPPKASQFRKGASGNPRGRPRGSSNWAIVLERALQEKVVINENGERRTVTKFVAAMKQLANQAASGNQGAIRLLTALKRSAEDKQPVAAPRQLDENDQKVMENVLKRFNKSVNGEGNVNK
jgi:hypothetical protein